MANIGRVGFTLLLALGAWCARADAQVLDSTYSLVEGWARLPAGVEAWGQTTGTEIDGQSHLWVFHRCFATICTGRDDVPTMLEYDLSGRLLDSWGESMFVWPHGLSLDPDGSLWVTDARGANGKGHTVMKLSRSGEVLMTLGTPGVAGADEHTFDGPADVAVAPDGSIFVADGHGNDRIVKFSPEGEYRMEWGEEGTQLGQLNEPHTLAFDSKGRLFVGDRLNQRIQVFDQNGRFLAVWPAIMASGIHISDDDLVYVADYQLRMGIVIARASDFSEVGFVDDALGEAVTVDEAGNVYVGEVLPRNLKKFTRRPGR